MDAALPRDNFRTERARAASTGPAEPQRKQAKDLIEFRANNAEEQQAKVANSQSLQDFIAKWQAQRNIDEELPQPRKEQRSNHGDTAKNANDGTQERGTKTRYNFTSSMMTMGLRWWP